MPDTVSPYSEDDADPYAADDTKNPHEAEGEVPTDDDEGDDESEAPPPKRGPGRPRKNPEG